MHVATEEMIRFRGHGTDPEGVANAADLPKENGQSNGQDKMNKHRSNNVALVRHDEATNTSRHDALKYGLIRNTLRSGTPTLHSRPAEEQQDTGHYEKQQDPVPARQGFLPWARISTESQYRRAPGSRTVKYPSNRKRQLPRRLT